MKLLNVILLSGQDVPEPFLSNAVFMTHKWFISSEELLRKFMQRYYILIMTEQTEEFGRTFPMRR